MTIQPDTYKSAALRVIANADDPITAGEVTRIMEPAPTDTSMTLKRLYDDGYVDRDGAGNRGDAYRYQITAKGDAAVRDLSADDETPDDEPAGLEALFGGEVEGETPPDPEVVDRLEDLKRTVEDLEARIHGVEEATGNNNVAREDIKHRLRQIEARVDEYEDADRLVALSGEDVVRLVDMVAQSDARSGRKRRDMVAKILGHDTEDRPSTLKATSDDAAETTDTD